jgi:transposase
VTRSRIVLLWSNDVSVATIATRLHVARGTVRLWIRRFAQGGLAAIQRDAPGRGRRRGSSPVHALMVLEATRERIARGTRPTARQVAADARVSAASVCRIWKRYGVAPRAGDIHLIGKLEQLISETPGRCR